MPDWFLVEAHPRRLRAREASVGEVVRTPSGSVLAEPNRYVLEDDEGDHWLPPRETLERYFRMVEEQEA
jgi:hypothetical protein